MKIISHRGYWKEEKEKKSDSAFHRTFKLGFGTETDFRDFNNELVISHDAPVKGEQLSVNEFCDIYNEYDNSLPLALNIKSDGLQNHIEELIITKKINNYFVFDMSMPDTIGYLTKNMNVFIRQSEYEKDLPFYNEAKGIWLDAFKSIWYTEKTIETHISNGKKVAIVSAELHKRDYIKHWKTLKEWSIIDNEKIILCTDFPELAIKYFKK